MFGRTCKSRRLRRKRGRMLRRSGHFTVKMLAKLADKIARSLLHAGRRLMRCIVASSHLCAGPSLKVFGVRAVLARVPCSASTSPGAPALPLAPRFPAILLLFGAALVALSCALARASDGTPAPRTAFLPLTVLAAAPAPALAVRVAAPTPASAAAAARSAARHGDRSCGILPASARRNHMQKDTGCTN